MLRTVRWQNLLAGAGLLGAAGCGSLHTSLIPVGGVTAAGHAHTAQIREDSAWPVLLRGVDEHQVSVWHAVTFPFMDYAYVIAPGARRLLVTTPPAIFGSLPIPVGNTRCYVIAAELLPGRAYRLKEADDRRQALLLLDPGGETIARGPLVDEFFTGTRTCRWPGPPSQSSPEPAH